MVPSTAANRYLLHAACKMHGARASVHAARNRACVGLESGMIQVLIRVSAQLVSSIPNHRHIRIDRGIELLDLPYYRYCSVYTQHICVCVVRVAAIDADARDGLATPPSCDERRAEWRDRALTCEPQLPECGVPGGAALRRRAQR